MRLAAFGELTKMTVTKKRGEQEEHELSTPSLVYAISKLSVEGNEQWSKKETSEGEEVQSISPGKLIHYYTCDPQVHLFYPMFVLLPLMKCGRESKLQANLIRSPKLTSEFHFISCLPCHHNKQVSLSSPFN